MSQSHRFIGIAALALIAGIMSGCAASAAAPLAPAVTRTPAFDTSGLPAGVKAILAFYPLAPGATWTYQVTVDQGLGSGKVDHWQGDVTGTVTNVTVEDGHPIYQIVWAGVQDEAMADGSPRSYVVREAGIYKAFDDGHALDLARAGAVIDTVYMAWPLKNGQIWGDPAMIARGDGMYVWQIGSVETISVPAGSIENCYKAAMMTNPDTTVEWFCPGKGLARFEYHHHGSIVDQVWELASFKPGS